MAFRFMHQRRTDLGILFGMRPLGTLPMGSTEETLMKSFTLSAIAVAIALIGMSGTAAAQVRTDPPGKLFFEGDIVRHNLEGQQGPFCVLQNRFKRGEAIAWRIRVLRPDGTVADNTVLKSVVVELGNGQKIPTEFGPHGNPATDYFWAESWTVPQNYPTGSLGYNVIATMQDDSVVTWEPFTRPATQLSIIEGAPVMATN